jgi:hypothetical protein
VAPLPARKSKSTKHVSFADPLCTFYEAAELQNDDNICEHASDAVFSVNIAVAPSSVDPMLDEANVLSQCLVTGGVSPRTVVVAQVSAKDPLHCMLVSNILPDYTNSPVCYDGSSSSLPETPYVNQTRAQTHAVDPQFQPCQALNHNSS